MNAPSKPAMLAEPESLAEVKPKRRGRRSLLMFSVPLLLALVGGYFWLTGGRYVTTENAYVHQPLVQVSADVPGRVVEVDVTENETIQAGTVMFRLDPAPFKIALEQADAALAAAKLQMTQLQASYATAQAQLKAARALLDIKNREYDRQVSLGNRGVASATALDEAKSAEVAAENAVALAEDGVSAAAAALGGNPKIAPQDFPAVRAAQAQRDTAERNLKLATVRAPVTGVVSQADNLTVGQYVSPGAMVASLVQSHDSWVQANFKETQLAALKVGQPVTVQPDSYPGLTLHGTVASFGSATGSQFSLIPAQNATGNWVKVVQRVPVRIEITPQDGYPLRDGMSVGVSVDTGANRLTMLEHLK